MCVGLADQGAREKNIGRVDLGYIGHGACLCGKSEDIQQKTEEDGWKAVIDGAGGGAKRETESGSTESHRNRILAAQVCVFYDLLDARPAPFAKFALVGPWILRRAAARRHVVRMTNPLRAEQSSTPRCTRKLAEVVGVALSEAL
eukprot:6201004-Pleurochrysis_carterae.AAC.3